ncbi:MAG: helicase HerA domain-containing protein [Terricaulis sp.]
MLTDASPLKRAALSRYGRQIVEALSHERGEWTPVSDLAASIFNDAPKGGLTANARVTAEVTASRDTIASCGYSIEIDSKKGLRLVAAQAEAKVEPKKAPPRELREGEIELGRAGADVVGCDLAKLVDGRCLIQGNSGAGKSMLLRRIFEQTFGRLQQVLLDPDGEFVTLREEFDVVVLTAADIERVGGRALAFHLREHRYSAVVDLSDATAEARLAFTADFASGMIDAPAEHWAPCLVLIDEAQTFAPHYDAGDVEADTRKRATAALADMMGRGRKRGVAGVLATGRLAETAKAVVAKATNIIIGRTILDRDLERAGALLGYTAGHARALRTLGDGEFVAIGPAVAGPHRVRFKAGAVVSRHAGRTPTMSAPPTLTASAAASLLSALPTQEGGGATPAPVRGPAGARNGRRGRDWTPQEDAIIRAGYKSGLKIRDIGEQLAEIGFSTSTSNISGRAAALGLVSERQRAEWCDEEDQIIRDGYAGEVKIMDIVANLEAAGFMRGRVAVQMRAINIGVTRDRVKYWTEPEKKIAIAGLESGKQYREIVEDLRKAGFDRGLTSIFKFAQKNNFCRKGDSWTPEETAELERLYNAKVPPKEIAEQLGKTIGSIRTRASNLGLKQRIAWTDEEYKILRDGHAEGKALTWCAERIGRPYPNVAATAKRIGLSFARGKA